MRSYDVTAEFYDLLHAADYLRTTRRLLDRWLGDPQVGVIDVGAGTGIATELLAMRCDVTVHSVEPAASMRAILLSRLAGRTELLSHVRVHARPAARLGLASAADVAICLNTMATLDETERADALRSIARALVRGGILIVQRPPEAPGPERSDLPSWQLGGDIYSGDVTCTRVDDGLVEWRFAYRVSRDGIIVREEFESFAGHLLPAVRFDRELAKAGFTPVDNDEPDVVIAHRIG